MSKIRPLFPSIKKHFKRVVCSLTESKMIVFNLVGQIVYQSYNILLILDWILYR